MVTSRYYYNSLGEDDKKIYKAIYDGIMRYKPYVDLDDLHLTDQRVGWIYHCVLWDNPFIFSVGEYAMWHATSENGTRIKMTTLCDVQSEKKYRKKIEDEVNKILYVPKLKEMSDFQKEVFVHDFIINNISYDETYGNDGAKIEPYTVYGALVEHKAVCEGIAKTAKLLLNILDVKCIVVSGKYNGNSHAWNIVKLDDWAYNLDVTMDMGLVIHKGMMRYNYFNFRDTDIDSYKPDNAHTIPECTAIQYNYVIKAGGFVSNYERLKNYIEKCLKSKKRCMYLKVNKNVDEDYRSISFDVFQKEVDKAYVEVASKLGINAKRFIDTTGSGDIVTVELEYLK